MATTLQLRFLGSIEVKRNGKLVSGFESRKALALLGYLVATGQPIPRGQLADLFWGAKLENQARANLSRALHNLSTLLPGAFTSDHHTIQFARSPECWLDLEVFEEAAAKGTAESLASASNLYRDEFMSGIYVDDSPDFEIWLVAQREHWRRRQVQVLDKLIRYHRDCGSYEAAIDVASRLLKVEPWLEEAHEQMIWLLARTGQRSAALRQYEIARKAIVDQLGVEPGGQLKSLYERVKAGENAPEGERPGGYSPPPLPLHNLPMPLTSFVAREGEVSDILENLTNPGCRLMTLVGPPGAGKTRLALEASSRLVEQMPNGVFFVSLASVGEARFLTSAIAASLGFSPSGPAEPRTQLLDYLAEKKLLLVLDNFEHLLANAGFLTEILQKAPRVKILVTSQERLNLSGEWLLLIEGLEFPKGNDVEGIEQYAAVKLFVDRARSVEPHFALSPETRQPVVRICQLVEGLPLGLELAAAWVGKFSCRYIAREIERNLDFLATSIRDVPIRHRNLNAAMDWSFRLLSDSEAVVLRRLAVFAGRFSLEAASTVCVLGESEHAASGPLQSQMMPLLCQLVDKSLVISDSTSEEEARFVLLQPIRKFALHHLAESGEQEVVQERHARYFTDLVETALPKFRTAEREEWLRKVDADNDNLVAALEWSLTDSRRVETVLRLVAALAWYWYFRSRLEEGRTFVERVLALGIPLPPTSARVRFLHGAGMGAWLGGDYQAAAAFLGASLDLARAIDDKPSTAYALTFLGLVAMNRGHLDDARRFHEESGALFTDIGDRWGLALSLTNLELAATQQGDTTAGRAAIERAVAIFAELKDEWGEGLALNNQALSAYRRGEYAVARTQLEQAICIRRKVGEKWLLAQSLNYLGNVLLAEHNYARAYSNYRESMLLNRELGNRHGIAELLCGLAMLAAAMDKPAQAATSFGSAEALRETIGAPMPEPDRAVYEATRAVVVARMGETAWKRQWEAGRQMSLEQATDSALDLPIGV